eukprot:1188454-Prorocentrum_minimum.AAC.1
MASPTVLNVSSAKYASSPCPNFATSRRFWRAHARAPCAASIHGHVLHNVAARRGRDSGVSVGSKSCFGLSACSTRGGRDVTVKATAGLTQKQIEFYHSEGEKAGRLERLGSPRVLYHSSAVEFRVVVSSGTRYLVIEDFATKEECKELRERAEEIIDEFDPKTVSIFSTTDQVSVVCLTSTFALSVMPGVGNRYSANNVSCFFEEKAFDDKRNLKQAKSKSINKIGHVRHERNQRGVQFRRGMHVLNLPSIYYQAVQ